MVLISEHEQYNGNAVIKFLLILHFLQLEEESVDNLSFSICY